MGQLLYSYRTSTHRRPKNEQVTKEFHHYRCKLFQLIWTSTGYQRTLHQEILQKYTARQLRLAFLTQLWNTKVDFSESSMSGEVRSIETTFNVSDKPWSVKKWLTRFTLVPEFLYLCEGSRRPSWSGSIPIRWSTSLLNPGSWTDTNVSFAHIGLFRLCSIEHSILTASMKPKPPSVLLSATHSTLLKPSCTYETLSHAQTFT